jgi:aurora kinase
MDYVPPEMVESKTYSSHVDLWALGVLTYEFLTGGPPFEDPSQEGESLGISIILQEDMTDAGTNRAPVGTWKKIRKVDYSIPSYVSPEAKDLIQKVRMLF